MPRVGAETQEVKVTSSHSVDWVSYPFAKRSNDGKLLLIKEL